MILYNIFLGDFLVLKLVLGYCTKSALQASRSAAPARKSAFHIHIYIQSINICVYIFMCGWSRCMLYVLCSAAE